VGKRATERNLTPEKKKKRESSEQLCMQQRARVMCCGGGSKNWKAGEMSNVECVVSFSWNVVWWDV